MSAIRACYMPDDYSWTIEQRRCPENGGEEPYHGNYYSHVPAVDVVGLQRVHRDNVPGREVKLPPAVNEL
jgi:hypothetical protein